LAVHDYTRFHETAEFKLHDLDIALFWRQIQHLYVDIFADAAHDYRFTIQAWRELLKRIDISSFQTLLIFSDNGLKSKENLFNFSKLASELKINLELHFFAPYHGHSVCDAHFGQAKLKLRRELAGKLIRKPSDIVEIFSTLPSTVVIYLQKITTPSQTITRLPLGIQKFFQFGFDGVGKLRCYQKSMFGDPTIQPTTQGNKQL